MEQTKTRTVSSEKTSMTSSHDQLLTLTLFRNSKLAKMPDGRDTISDIKFTTSTD
jgi:hypothetical protein